jgi:pimeloyl-ACP methyl ester carboxylesterase
VTTFVLIPGAGGVAWYWSHVVGELRKAGHEAIAVDLPGEDESAGLTQYADIVISKCHDDVVLVAQSLGGFTAPLVCEQIAVRALVFVNAMIPERGETPGAWWGNVGWEAARISAAHAGGYSAEFDLETYFLHDVAPDVAAEGEPYQRNEADAVFASSCAFTAWPDVAIHVLAGTDDRFFPVEFQRQVARDRLGIETDTLAGGHLIALANATGVADYLNRVAEPA